MCKQCTQLLISLNLHLLKFNNLLAVIPKILLYEVNKKKQFYTSTYYILIVCIYTVCMHLTISLHVIDQILPSAGGQTNRQPFPRSPPLNPSFSPQPSPGKPRPLCMVSLSQNSHPFSIPFLRPFLLYGPHSLTSPPNPPQPLLTSFLTFPFLTGNHTSPTPGL